MNGITPVEEALKLPGGASFYRCALQVNPHHYLNTYRGQHHEMSEEEYVKVLLTKCIELDIHAVAITDHNHVGSINLFRSEAKKYDVHIFPGFEIASSEGVHILCIYPLDTSTGILSRYLGEFGIRDTDPSSTLSKNSFSSILRGVKEQGGVSIAAHITSKGGLLEVFSGQPRVNAWKDENLLAVQIPGSIDNLPENYKAIIRNQDNHYKRRRAVGYNLAISVINAKDVAKPGDLSDHSTWCFIKMSEVSVEGLRQAFLDPDSRIRLASDPLPVEHAEFLAMCWQGGFLDGAAVHFNENLNVLIGGRGAGKSTVIESLRCVLGLDPLGEEARKAHEGVVRKVLRSGTKISLLVRSHRPVKSEYLIERTIPNPPVVHDKSGNLLNLTPPDVIPQVEIYGQHEISELTRSGVKLTHLLERFIDHDENLIGRKDELKRELERSRQRILDVRKEQQQNEGRLAALPGLEETRRRFQEAGAEEKLKEKSLLVSEEKVLQTASDRLEPFRELSNQLDRELPIDRAFLSEKALESLPGKDILAGADNILDSLDRQLKSLGIQFKEILDRGNKGLNEVVGRWKERKNDVQEKYEKILRELQESNIDGEEFISLRRRIEELRPLKERQDTLKRDEKEHLNQRRNLLVEWEDVRAEEFRKLGNAAKKVNKKLAGRVLIDVIFEGDREPLFQLLRDQVGGRLSETIDTLCTQDDFSIKSFADVCAGGLDALLKKFNIPTDQANRIVQAGPGLNMQIEELDLFPITTIKLNVAPEGQLADWQSLDDVSTGQKATAILLLLLLESRSPLIVDQPEDDLDNRFITDGVVPKMREEKRLRQFIFATHNANIPVLGDAELIVGLNAMGEAEQGKAGLPAEHMGSIDARPVRELVEEVLEGGKDAFEMRRLKYGF